MYTILHLFLVEPTDDCLWQYLSLALRKQAFAGLRSDVNPIRHKVPIGFSSHIEFIKKQKGRTRRPFRFLVEPTGVEPVSENLLI